VMIGQVIAMGLDAVWVICGISSRLSPSKALASELSHQPHNKTFCAEGLSGPRSTAANFVILWLSVICSLNLQHAVRTR